MTDAEIVARDAMGVTPSGAPPGVPVREMTVGDERALHLAAPALPRGAVPPVGTANPARPAAQREEPAAIRAALWLLALLVGALLVRVLLIGDQSAYMDEGTYIMTGRTLVEQHAVYFRALDWTYGSYLWSVVAAVADMWGGLMLVRIVNASLGAVMALATAIMALRLTPRDASGARPRTVAMIAGLIMALCPTAVGVGRFGTYDALAGAALMSGIALLIIATQAER